MRTYTFERCPYSEDEVLFSKSEITFSPGLTALVGCNGAGKTSMLHQIRDALDESQGEFLVYYDNLRDGRSAARDAAARSGRYDVLATMISSSEGEELIVDFGQFAASIKRFAAKHKEELRDLWVLVDGVDSGLSIDNIVDMKQFVADVLSPDLTTQDICLYVVIAANSYEMCRDERCLDVASGKYLRFENYEEYKAFILKSAEAKSLRYMNF